MPHRPCWQSPHPFFQPQRRRLHRRSLGLAAQHSATPSTRGGLTQTGVSPRPLSSVFGVFPHQPSSLWGSIIGPLSFGCLSLPSDLSLQAALITLSSPQSERVLRGPLSVCGVTSLRLNSSLARSAGRRGPTPYSYLAAAGTPGLARSGAI